MQKRDSKGKFRKAEPKQEKDMKQPFQGSKKGFATATVTQLSNGAIIDIYGNDVKIGDAQFKEVLKGNVTRYAEFFWDNGKLVGRIVKRNPHMLLCDKPLDQVAYERYVYGEAEDVKGACCGGKCKNTVKCKDKAKDKCKDKAKDKCKDKAKGKDNVKSNVKVPAKGNPIMFALAFDYDSKEAFDKFFAKDLIAGAEAIIMQVHGKK